MPVECSDCESCTMTAVREEAWQFYGDYGAADYPSMSEGIFALKALEGGKWKWNRETPGNGTTRAFFLCNSHTTCAAGDGKQMKCVLLNGRFTILHKGEHTSTIGEFPINLFDDP